MSKGPTRHIRVRAGVAYPAVSCALAIAVALALTPFGPSKVAALTPTTFSMETVIASPTPSDTSTTPSPTVTLSSTPSATPSPTVNPSPSSSSAADLFVVAADHHVLARIEGPPFQADYLPVDQPVPDGAPFQTFRVRFQLHDAGTAPITMTPRLEYRPEGTFPYTVVPEEPVEGVPFHAVREWVPSLGLGAGSIQGPLGEDIAVADLRIGTLDGLAMTGHRSMGSNPDQQITLPSASYTEQEFTIKLTMDAQYLSGYELRVTDGGTPLSGTDTAMIRLGAAPAAVLSPDQHQGVPAPGPKPTSSPTAAAVPTSAGSAFPAVFAIPSVVSLTSAEPMVATATADPTPTAATPAPAATTGPATTADPNPTVATFPLVTSALPVGTDPLDQIHGPYSMTTDKCGICHRTHTAQASSLLAKGSQPNLGSQSALCLSCHDGTGADPAAGAQFGLVGLPANNATTRDYYSHDAAGANPTTAHTDSSLNEFGGVINRHSECSDCHNPHNPTATAAHDSSPTTDGWDASRRLAGVSGVSVVNGAAGAAPAYTFLNGIIPGVATNLVTREYQLCFKCHSGFTTLTDNTGLKASQYALDKAIELNPANPSFHPVEAPGKNPTTAMAASLAGTSPYKLWNFTVGDTVRCLNCHASSSTPDPAPTAVPPVPGPAAGSALAPHTSLNRGILIRPYKDRVLESATAVYSAGDFALCYVCHAEEPFVPNGSSSTKTNFAEHSRHLTLLAGKGTGSTRGTDIDTAGDGVGNAICAECHFRLHSTTYKVGDQVVDGTRLVNFAPNVQPNGTTLSWTPAGAVGSGSCTLTCHGYTHTAAPYTPPTPTPTPTP